MSGKTFSYSGSWYYDSTVCFCTIYPTQLQRITDGLYTLSTQGNGGYSYSADVGPNDTSNAGIVSVDLGGEYNITQISMKVGVYGYPAPTIRNYVTLETSSNGSVWTTIALNSTVSNTETVFNNTYTVSLNNTRYIRSRAWNDYFAYYGLGVRWYEIQAEGNATGAIVGNWTFDQGTGSYANDSSTFNNNGTITGAAWSTDSVNGTSLSFNGSYNSVSVPSSDSLNLISAGTFAVWIKPNNLSGIHFINTKYADMYRIYLDGSTLYASLDGTGNLASSVSISNNTWTYVSWSYAPSNLSLYVNNILTASTTSSDITTSSDPLYFGQYGTNIYFYSGIMDEAKLYNYALTSLERTSDYQQFHPVPAYPTGGMTITATYPPQTTDINFSWHDTVYSGDRLEVATDSNFNIKVVDVTITNDYYLATLNSGDTYYWRVRQYNTTTGTYGITSRTENFSITSASNSTGQGVQGIAYELINNLATPVSEAEVHIYNDTYSDFMVVGDNGYYLFDGLANGTYYVYALKQDYDKTDTFPVQVNGTIMTKNLLMKKFISPYVPNFVYEKFIVRGLFDNSFAGVSVTVYEGDSLTALTTGTTDTMGQAVFRLIKDQRYRVVFSGGGIGSDITIYVYAKEESYLVRILTGFPTGGDLFTSISFNLSVTSINATWSNLSLVYNDTKQTTNIIWFYSRNTSTGSNCTVFSTSNTAYLNCSVLASGTYFFGFNATSSVFGTFQQNKVINFQAGNVNNPVIPLQSTDTTLLQWASISLIVFVAALFSVRTVKYGAVVVPILALFLWVAGWFQPVPGNSTGSFLLLSTAVCLGIMIYMRKSEMKAAVT